MSERSIIRRAPRHSCEITADRLAKHIEEYHDRLDGAERDDFSRVKFILDEIADGER